MIYKLYKDDYNVKFEYIQIDEALTLVFLEKNQYTKGDINITG